MCQFWRLSTTKQVSVCDWLIHQLCRPSLLGGGTAIEVLASNEVVVVHEFEIVGSIAASFIVTIVLVVHDISSFIIVFIDLFLCLIEHHSEVLDDAACAELFLSRLESEKSSNRVNSSSELGVK